MSHVRLDVKAVYFQPLVKNVLPHWFLKKTTVFKNVVQDISCQVLNVLDAQLTVLLVLQPINVSIARMVSIFTEVLAMLLAQLVQSPIKIPSNVLPVTVHAERVQAIQAHVQVVNQEKDIYKLVEMTKNVSKNVLKELSHPTVYVKSATSDVLNVLVLQETVLLAQLEDTFTTVHVGIIVQVSSTMENVLMNVHQDIGEPQIKNVSNVQLNVKLVILTQLV